MLRKTLIALSAAAALGVSSGAMAASHGGHGASGAGASGMSVPSGSGSGPGPGKSSSSPSAPGPVTTMGPSQVQPKGPSGQTMGPSGNTWTGGRHHHRHDRFFFGVGFAGPYYDYGYDSCWRIVPTYYGGWRRVWVCGDYPYGGYYGGY